MTACSPGTLPTSPLALRDLFRESVDLEHPSFQVFIRGYAAHCPIDGDMLRHIPTFLRFAKLLTYARLGCAIDLPPDQARPDWLRTLEEKLDRWAIAYETSLESRGREQASEP
jgi:Ser/Thr protein kinase RdoA (MazF antagonist)